MSDRLPSRAFRFGRFVLDASAYELRRDGRPLRLERRPMELLIFLLERRGELVTRDEIVERLWDRDVFIDIDASVNTVIRKVRRALGDDADRPTFIQTVQGKGYRFIADVESDGRAVIAVLPFAGIQRGADQEYVADGLTEETIAQLSQIDPGRLIVIGRTTSMALRGTTRILADIARELGVDYLLEGATRTDGGRCRVTARLIRARDQIQVWADTYEREASDLLGLQAELGTAIARQIALRLSPPCAAGRRTQTGNREAYDLYLRGRYHYNQMTHASAVRALECFRRATALDPAYALAWAGLADAYSSFLFNSDTRASEVASRAREAAAQALKHGGSVAEAHTAVGRVQFLFDWDWQAAEMTLRRAVALDPSSAQSHWMLGHALSLQGRHDEACAAAQRARELDPLSALSHTMSAQIAFCAGDAAAAARYAQDALLAEPNDWVAYWQLGQAYQQMNRVDEALQALTEASRLSNGNAKPVSVSAYTLAASGRVSDARDVLIDLERVARQRYVPPCSLALVHAGLNEPEKALDYLESAAAVRDVHLIYVPLDPKWKEFRGNRRFQQLLQRCGFSHMA
jgi:TolB-like protein/Flp pilus assembly protein TadD